jgi:hypothetical protein
MAKRFSSQGERRTACIQETISGCRGVHAGQHLSETTSASWTRRLVIASVLSGVPGVTVRVFRSRQASSRLAPGKH